MSVPAFFFLNSLFLRLLTFSSDVILHLHSSVCGIEVMFQVVLFLQTVSFCFSINSHNTEQIIMFAFDAIPNTVLSKRFT